MAPCSTKSASQSGDGTSSNSHRAALKTHDMPRHVHGRDVGLKEGSATPEATRPSTPSRYVLTALVEPGLLARISEGAHPTGARRPPLREAASAVLSNAFGKHTVPKHGIARVPMKEMRVPSFRSPDAGKSDLPSVGRLHERTHPRKSRNLRGIQCVITTLTRTSFGSPAR